MSWSGEERRHQRWTDERIDDLATLVKHSDERLDAIHNLVATHDLQIIELLRDKRAEREAAKSRQEQTFAMRVVIVGCVLTFLLAQIGTLIAVLATSH